MSAGVALAEADRNDQVQNEQNNALPFLLESTDGPHGKEIL